MPVIRRYRDTLPSDLTPEELQERGKQLADLVQEIDGAEADERERRSEVKKRLDELAERRTDLAFVVHRGQEDREANIEERADYERGTYSKVRLDTGEVIFERPLKPEERQAGLPGMASMAKVLEETAAAVNAGAFDTPDVKVTAKVRK